MSAASVMVRALTPDDHDWVVRTLTENWGSPLVARRGEAIDASVLPGHVATVRDRRVGLVLTATWDEEYEVVSISVTDPRQGIGRALLERCFDEARALDMKRIWLITTNNNVAAFAFYQHLGMDLCGFYRDGVSQSRSVKPSIPGYDGRGLPIAHELEFELHLR
jgi:ribosomal protein S18 acetylase RimI-like enzyme